MSPKIIKSFFSGFLYSVSNIFNLFNYNDFDTKNHVQFIDLASNNLPKNNDDLESKNIINWYIKNRINANYSRIIKHNVKEIKDIRIKEIEIISKSNYYLFPSNKNSLRYLISIIVINTRAFIDLLRGRWWHPFLLKQSSISKRFKFCDPNQLAEEYLFPNSSWICRPLWTYEAMELGSKITLYFYSTNCEFFKDKYNDSIYPLGYCAMNWPNYLVWDEYQLEFIKKVNQENSKIMIVGPIWFDSTKSTQLLDKNRSIAIFDVSPYRDSIFSIVGAPDRYYRSENNINFINHIVEIARKHNFLVKFKQKRDLKKAFELKYINFIKEVKILPEVHFIDSNVSALDVIDSSDFTISMPFTSTSIIAKESGYKSCFYDPTGELFKNDPASHGVQLLSNKDELEKWILSNIEV
jgi:polysaccharide biosynthesis PFTS motif protein